MKRKQKWAGIGLVCAVAIGLNVSASSSADEARQKMSSGAMQVKIDNFTFAPDALTVPAGTTVQWVNRDDIPHTVVSDDKSTFKSKAMDTDDNYSYTFSKPGTHTYFCSIHPKMTGKVVVQ